MRDLFAGAVVVEHEGLDVERALRSSGQIEPHSKGCRTDRHELKARVMGCPHGRRCDAAQIGAGAVVECMGRCKRWPWRQARATGKCHEKHEPGCGQEAPKTVHSRSWRHRASCRVTDARKGLPGSPSDCLHRNEWGPTYTHASTRLA